MFAYFCVLFFRLDNQLRTEYNNNCNQKQARHCNTNKKRDQHLGPYLANRVSKVLLCNTLIQQCKCYAREPLTSNIKIYQKRTTIMINNAIQLQCIHNQFQHFVGNRGESYDDMRKHKQTQIHIRCNKLKNNQQHAYDVNYIYTFKQIESTQTMPNQIAYVIR